MQPVLLVGRCGCTTTGENCWRWVRSSWLCLLWNNCHRVKWNLLHKKKKDCILRRVLSNDLACFLSHYVQNAQKEMCTPVDATPYVIHLSFWKHTHTQEHTGIYLNNYQSSNCPWQLIQISYPPPFRKTYLIMAPVVWRGRKDWTVFSLLGKTFNNVGELEHNSRHMPKMFPPQSSGNSQCKAPWVLCFNLNNLGYLQRRVS